MRAIKRKIVKEQQQVPNIYIVDGSPNGKPAIGRGKMNKQRRKERKEKKISLEIGELRAAII